jgi:hypothetical protein
VRTFKKAVACAVVAMAVGSTMAVRSALPAQASISHPAVVSENPADTTPHIVFDAPSQDVRAYAQVGRTMYAGGLFNQVQDWARTTTYARQNFVAFDRETGVVSPLNLAFNGTVGAIEATADGTALFISGSFSNVNGVTRRGLVKYDLANNRIDPTFLPGNLRTVSDIELANGAVIAAGNFAKHLVALNPTTGADTGAIAITVAGIVAPADETRIQHIAVSPNGTRLVATGNFATVNGQGRKRAFMLNLGPTATLSTWHAPRFDEDCFVFSRRASAQGVDFSPDGTYFVIVATGGAFPRGICDAAARFETANVSASAAPTWINWTGGDSLYSVAVTGPAVYVGGHQRWLDNPYGIDSAGPGAVSRPGIGAIDPVTGRALAWNPTKSRNHGTMVLYATPQGLWVGSDGERFGGEDHYGIGFAPLDAAAARPDARIRRGAGPLAGNDIYNTTGAGQTRTGSAARGHSVTFYASIQNDAAFAETLRLRGHPSTANFTVAYRNPAGTNITNQVTAGTYTTPNLAPGGTHQIKITVTVRNTAPNSASAARTLTATSTTHPTIKDTVRFITGRRA